MSQDQPNNPLHGVTLKALLEELVERHGWWELASRIEIRCFSHDPSIKSSLKFLRKTPWARAQVEALYLADLQRAERNRKRNQRRAGMRAHRAQAEAEAEGRRAEGRGAEGRGAEGGEQIEPGGRQADPPPAPPETPETTETPETPAES